MKKQSTNPKKNKDARRARNPLPVFAKPTGKIAMILEQQKKRKNLCKTCKVREKRNGSRFCQECSDAK